MSFRLSAASVSKSRAHRRGRQPARRNLALRRRAQTKAAAKGASNSPEEGQGNGLAPRAAWRQTHVVKGDPEGGYISHPEEGDDAGWQHVGLDDIDVSQHNEGSSVRSSKLKSSGIPEEILSP